MDSPDFELVTAGSCVTIRPLSLEAYAWMEKNYKTEEPITFGPRRWKKIERLLKADGLEVSQIPPWPN